MKSTEQMANELFARKERYLAIKKERRKLALKIGIPVAAFALVILIGFCSRLPGVSETAKPGTDKRANPGLGSGQSLGVDQIDASPDQTGSEPVITDPEPDTETVIEIFKENTESALVTETDPQEKNADEDTAPAENENVQEEDEYEEEEEPETKGPTAAELAEEKGFSLGVTGENEQWMSTKLPIGVPRKKLIDHESICDGAEEFIPYAYHSIFREGLMKWQGGKVVEEYAYYFDEDLFQTAEKHEGPGPLYGRQSCASLNVIMKGIGKDGLIVIGRATGPREGHLAYYHNTLAGTWGIQGFTLTDFEIEDTLFGSNNLKSVRIVDDYYYCSLRKDGEYKNYLNNMDVVDTFSVLKNEELILLFLKKEEGSDCYRVYGGRGGIPLPEDYKKYNQQYLNNLAKYLNNDPEALWDGKPQQYMGYGETVPLDGPVTHIGRSTSEALKANSTDLVVTLAQTYRIKIWPCNSVWAYAEGIRKTPLLFGGCQPDVK